MLTMAILSAVTFLVVGSFHFAILSRVASRLDKSDMSAGSHHFLLLGTIGLLHVFEAAVYTVAFRLGQSWGLGGFKTDGPLTFMDVYYFSVVNYTTLGLGDIYPSGHLRFLAGIESLEGFLLLSCSASYLFAMAKQRIKD